MNIPGYQLGREISVGEYCSVYNALELETSKTVTVRFYQHELSSNPQFCQHLKNTTQLLLNKPIGNIISIKKAGWEIDNCYLITDYFPCAKDYQPLQTIFTIDEVLNFGLQLANSLSKLHALGIVHGGVSTSNLVFHNLNQLTLGVISFPRTLQPVSSLPELSVSLDAACYMAPEFSSGLETRSDFYSIGVVLYELLFRKKPFNTDNAEQLKLQKESMQYEIPDEFDRKLYPLFAKLLAANPDKRIKNSSEYSRVIEQCGFKISNTSSYSIDLSESTVPDTQPGSTSLSSQSKKIFIFSTIAGLLMIGIIYLVISSSEPEYKKEVNASSSPTTIETTKDKIKTDSKSVLPGTKTSTENEKNATRLYRKSLQQIAANNYGAALMTINDALKESPGHSAALQVKQQIELEFEVRASLIRAEKLIKAGKLTRPENDNAYDAYLKILPLIKADDSRVHEGLQKIASKYFRMANRLIEKNDFAGARQYIDSGLTVLPDFEQLKQLDQFINEQQRQLLAQQQLKEQQIQRQKIAQEQLKRQQQLNEQNRLAALERERVVKKQRRIELEKQIEQQNKRNKINELLASAEKLLLPDQLSIQSLQNSLEIHSQLSTIADQDSRVSSLLRQIVDGYGNLALRQKEIPDLAEALSTANQGLGLDRNNSRLRILKNEIQSLIEEEQKKANEVPFIGTF